MTQIGEGLLGLILNRVKFFQPPAPNFGGGAISLREAGQRFLVLKGFTVGRDANCLQDELASDLTIDDRLNFEFCELVNLMCLVDAISKIHHRPTFIEFFFSPDRGIKSIF
jgi:hypothetical protein